ncbi:MAG: hypothetical protein PVS2B2_26780 [Candidatus Acidiferrum sp.]
MSDLEKLLESVAYELAEMAASNGSHSGKDNVIVLKARLLPLLEAGEAMRKKVSYHDGTEHCPHTRWDAAKRKAMEGLE